MISGSRLKGLLKSVLRVSAAVGLVAIVTMVVRWPADLLNWLVPSSGYVLDSGIAYGDRARQRLDVYRPAQPPDQPPPVVVYFYGGGWSGGNRGGARFVGQFLASEGFVAVIPDYRVYPEVVFPGFLEDGAKALRWVQDHIAEFGGDPQSLALMGSSAGAYNAMMLALDRRYGAAAGLDATRIRGVVGLVGPYDFELDVPNRRRVFGAVRDPREAEPVNFAAAGAPPVLLVTGDADELVDPEHSRSLARHLQAVKSPVLLREVPGLRHNDAVLLLSLFGYPDTATRDAIVRFLKRPDAAEP